MTDEQIIKALECCGKDKHCGYCLYFETVDISECLKVNMTNALDLINRQKAEIEKLEIELQAMRGAANSYKAEVERLEKEIEEANVTDRESELQALTENRENAKIFSEAIKHVRFESIKEFAERIKEELAGLMDEFPVLDSDIDKLVNELIHQPTKIEHNSLCETETYESR